jgi:septal ring factor EnvC (AmiA/AmiB activator)
MWAQRAAQASEQVVKLQQEKGELVQKNQALQDQLNKVKQDVDQLSHELADANAMLVDVRKELEKWRVSVLGFRQEMREAQQTQLEATAKIMKMLGGEMTLPAQAASQGAPAPAAEVEPKADAPHVPAPVAPVAASRPALRMGTTQP